MAAVDGLVSGLNTGDIIKQLMQLERQPQVRLQTRRSTVESAIGALRNLNTKFTAITAAAAKMTADKGWQLTAANSSDPTRVAVATTPGAPQGTLSLRVDQLAAAGSVLSTGFVTSPSTQVVEADSVVTLTKGANGQPFDVPTGDGSLASLISAINRSGAGVSASAIQLRSGEYQLQLASTTTGADTGLRLTTAQGADPFLTGTLEGMTTLVEGANAKLTVSGQPVERPTNTVSDLMTGLTLTVTKVDQRDASGAYVDPPVSVEVKSDSNGVAAQVQGLVDALNAASSDIRAVTGFNLETKNKGKLYGESSIRGLRDRLAGAVVGDGTTSAALAGVSIGRDGVVSFDKAKFLKALEANPAAVEAALGKDGLAGRVHALADTASRSKTAADGPGLIAGAITSKEGQVSSLKSNISNWDSRLELRERTLRRQFAALEKALGASQQQGQWLAGQIAGLPRGGS